MSIPSALKTQHVGRRCVARIQADRPYRLYFSKLLRSAHHIFCSRGGRRRNTKVRWWETGTFVCNAYLIDVSNIWRWKRLTSIQKFFDGQVSLTSRWYCYPILSHYLDTTYVTHYLSDWPSLTAFANTRQRHCNKESLVVYHLRGVEKRPLRSTRCIQDWIFSKDNNMWWALEMNFKWFFSLYFCSWILRLDTRSGEGYIPKSTAGNGFDSSR